MAKFRAELERDVATGSKATVGRLLDEWLAGLGSGLSQNTKEVYTKRVEKQIRPTLGDVRLDRLTVHMVDRFYVKIERDGLSPRSVLLVHSVLRSVLQLGVDWSWLPSNPADRANKPKVGREDPERLTMDQVSALYAAADDPPLKCAIGLAAATGLRRGELCGLQWTDIEDGVATIRRAWVSDDHSQHLSFIKSGGRRPLVLGSVGETVLERYRTAKMELWGEVLGEWVLSDDRGNEPLQARVLTDGFRSLAKKLGIAGVSFHTLRHFHQSLQVAQGIDVVTAARRAGHTPQVMLDHYAHGTTERDVAAAEIVSAALMPALSDNT